MEHVVLECGRAGQTWRDRWDTFCLVTPNWTVRLPGYPYDGSDPDGFMLRDEIAAYLDRYADAVAAPLREGVDVEGIVRRGGGGFVLRTSAGGVGARTVVLATGAYQRPHRPTGPEAFDPLGFPLHRDGASTAVPGLLFVGAHFLRTRKSSLLSGVGEDAAVVAAAIAADLRERS